MRLAYPLALAAVAAAVLTACGPGESSHPAAKPARTTSKPGRKCPDLNNHDSKDPCSPGYLEPYKPRFKRDTF